MKSLHSSPPRTVRADGWPYHYRAHIIEASWFGKPRWRFVVEQKWVHWSHHKTSGRFKTRDEAVSAANEWLDRHEAVHDKDFV
jgi:hypothetical protein